MRPLPKRINPLILPEVSPPYEELLERRRLGKTNLSVKPGQVGTSNATKPENLGMFEYAHLRAPLPKDLKGSEIFSFQPPQTNPEAYFLMRRSKDGYVSATGMFKIAFPWAKQSDEKTERDYLKSRKETSSDDIAGNIWISPDLALELAKEYGMFDWVRALLDPTEIDQSAVSPEKQISPPPKFKMPPSVTLTPSQPIARRTRTSVSPAKPASPKKTSGTRRPRQTRAHKEASAAASASLQSTLDAAASTVPDERHRANGEEVDGEEAKETPVKKSKGYAKVVESTVEKGGRIETRRVELATRILPDLDLEEDTAQMIARAREMVDEAVKGRRGKNEDEENEEDDEGEDKDEGAEAEAEAGAGAEIQPPSPKRPALARKRKVEDEVEGGHSGDDADGAASPVPAQPAKRARLLEDKLRRERVRNRALVGVTATLALA
ncbi:hypothetical protein GX48_06081 [Paracoccidioides brasiliensis]|nr:hypothetical protein GX48_06081 [Paracoccidioides brasiliensis]